MKRLLFVVVVLTVYAGSLMYKAKVVETARKREIPTMYKFRAQNGTPVNTVVAKRAPLVNYVSVTGVVQQNGLVTALVAPEIAEIIKIGSPVSTRVDANSVEGKVLSVSRKASLLSGLHELVMSFNRKIPNGFSVLSQIETKRLKGSIVVPREAVATRGGTAHAYVVVDSKVTRHDVTISASNDNSYAISNGIGSGDIVVVSDQRYLVNGEKVLSVNQ